MPDCTATTRRGQQCKRKAVQGEALCGPHLRRNNAAYTPEIADQLVAMLRAGNHLAAATRAVGISRQLVTDWLSRGAAGGEPYAEFRERVEQARGQAEVRHVTQIASASSDDWRAGAWMLERQLHADDDQATDVAELADTAAAAARLEAEATLLAIGEAVELSVGAIDRYAAAVAAWRTLEAHWEALGRPGTALGGATGFAQVPHPLVAQIAVARREAAMLGATLGLDPAGRSKLARRAVGAGRPQGAASAPDRASAPPRRRLAAVE